MDHPVEDSLTHCPYCDKAYKRVGNHLRYCPKRGDRDYSIYLSQKTLKKNIPNKSTPCPTCGKKFARLDAHLRSSATCKQQREGSYASIQSEPVPSPQSAELQSQQSMQLQSPRSQHTISSRSPHVVSTPKPLPPFNTPKSTEQWEELDSKLAQCLVPLVISATSPEEKHHILCQGIYDHMVARLGVKRVTNNQKKRVRDHERNLKNIRKEKNAAKKDLRRARRQAGNEDAVRELSVKFHRLIRLHSKAKKASLKARMNLEAFKARRECQRSFWKFASQLFSEDDSPTIPCFNQESAESFFTEVYDSHPRSYTRPAWLPQPSPVTTPFNEDPISQREVEDVIRRSRSSSSPSPLDLISYNVLKHCPSLLPALLDLYNSCWATSSIPQTWKDGVIRLIPKEAAKEKPTEPGNFRPIALTSCIGKVFSSILKRRWLSFMVVNGYMDRNVQKAFMPGVPGCIEQSTKLAAALREAHTKHRSIAVCWLDLVNAYGSVHHDLIHFSLRHFNINAPAKLRNIVANLYCGLQAIVTSPD